MTKSPFTDATTRAVLGVDMLLDGLRPASAAAKAVSLPFYGPDDVEAWKVEMACLLEAQSFCGEEPEAAARVLRALGEVPELERPLRRLAAGEALGDAELFELKRFCFFGAQVFDDALALLTGWGAPSTWPETLRRIMETIHPEDEPSPRFFLSDRLDEELARVRGEERLLKKAVSRARRGVEEAIIAAHGGSFDVDGNYRPPEEGVASEEILLEAGLVRSGPRLRASSAELDELDGALEQAADAARRVESEVRARLGDRLRRELAFFEALKKLLVAFDMRLARVRLFDVLDGCWAEPASSKGFVLEAGRSPCVRAPQPIDFASGSEATIVVGPNMGGKSSLLSLVGLATYCAQHALPVPAKRFVFTFVDAIVYVGADEPAAHQQEEGLSSFGREVRRLVSWWDQGAAGHRRLWLLDEIGRGTHPEEGAEIAVELIEALTQRGDFVVAATHFPRVAALAGARKLRIAGLVHRESLMAELARLPDDPRALTEALRRGMDYRPIATDAADIPRDARDIARALGLALRSGSE